MHHISYKAEVIWYDYRGGDDDHDMQDFDTYDGALAWIKRMAIGRSKPNAWINNERVGVWTDS